MMCILIAIIHMFLLYDSGWIFIVSYLQLNLHAFSLTPYRYLPCIFDATNGSKKCCRKPRHEMSEMSTKSYIYIYVSTALRT